MTPDVGWDRSAHGLPLGCAVQPGFGRDRSVGLPEPPDPSLLAAGRPPRVLLPGEPSRCGPYSVGIDPATGDIYIPEIGDGNGQTNDYIAHYRADGTFVREIRVPWAPPTTPRSRFATDFWFGEEPLLEHIGDPPRCDTGGSPTVKRWTASTCSSRTAMFRAFMASTPRRTALCGCSIRGTAESCTTVWRREARRLRSADPERRYPRALDR